MLIHLIMILSKSQASREVYHFKSTGGRITIKVPKGGHTGSKMSCLVELQNGFQCIDYGLLHISGVFWSTVLCFNREMPILLSLCLRGYVHYKKRSMPYYMAVLYSILWTICIKLHKDKPNNAIYQLLTSLSLSYIDIMSFPL